MNEDGVALDMVLQQGNRAKQNIMASDYSQCSLEGRKEFDLFVVDALIASLRHQRNGKGRLPIGTALTSSGLGAAAVAILEVVGKVKGWW